MSKKSLLITLVIILAGVSLFFILRQRGEAPTQEQPTPVVTEEPTTPSSEPIDTSDWQTYRNEEYGFEYKLPPNWTIEKTTTPAVFYLKSDKFKPVLLGKLATGEPFYSYGEVKIEIGDNPKNLSIQKRYLQLDDIYRLYIDNPKLPYVQSQINNHDVLIFETHRGFGSNLDSDEYQTVRILKIKNKILHFDYISQDKPDPRVERVLEEVVQSVSDV